MQKILTTKELQEDIGELLDYLHNTSEKSWDSSYISNKLDGNMKRFEDNIIYYHKPMYDKPISILFLKTNLNDLITFLTTKYTAIGKLQLKPQFTNYD
jgi:hypothetical protein